MKDQRQLPSQLLVSLQFGLFFVQAWLALPAVLAWAVPLSAWVAGFLGVLLGLWAIGSNRPGNFNIRPIPKTGGDLITHGPYRWMRHPMYTAFLLGAFALARTTDSAAAWLTWGSLLLVLWVKSSLEERWMQVVHPGYANYRRRTRRFIPWLY
jgi:protein-S-isoprenylcysteine O-methyltransferase Ste14